MELYSFSQLSVGCVNNTHTIGCSLARTEQQIEILGSESFTGEGGEGSRV